MAKKSIIILLVILILLIIIGFFGMNQLNQGVSEQTIDVGDITYNLPKDFHKEEFNVTNQSSIKINDGNHTFVLDVFNDTNITKYVNDYLKYVNNSNSTAAVSNFTIEDIEICKVVSNDTGATHFWYLYHGKTYSINTLASYEKTDYVFYELISSIRIKN